jgi:hypothetical protein
MKTLALIGAVFLVAAEGMASLAPRADELPPTLEATGFEQAEKVAFTPRYPLWSDGSTKRRWIALPPGAAIDRTHPDAWDFPPGTRLWKEFGHGRPVETRYIERAADGTWRFATYIWNAEGTRATLAPARGVVLEVDDAPGGKYEIPSRDDCLACHEGPAVPVLGYSAVQLGGTIVAPTEEARQALGYLHGNCGHCHNAGALAGVGLHLAQESEDPRRGYRRTVDSIDADRAREILRRFGADNRYIRMPPVGVRLPDRTGGQPVVRWLRDQFITTQEKVNTP